jgi:hypothetical protein
MTRWIMPNVGRRILDDARPVRPESWLSRDRDFERAWITSDHPAALKL